MNWLSSLFGLCAHTRTSFPQTPKRGKRETYVVCLSCGKSFAYDWQAMQRGAEIRDVQPVVGGLQEEG